MKRRLKGLFLVCIMCTILVGCGSSKITIPVDSVQKAVESCDLVPVNDSITTFYTTYSNQVLIVDYKGDRNNITVNVNSLIVDGKAVYYDAENDCFTTEPIHNN